MATAVDIRGITSAGEVVPLRVVSPSGVEPTPGALYQHVSDDPTSEQFLEVQRAGHEAEQEALRRAAFARQGSRGALSSLGALAGRVLGHSEPTVEAAAQPTRTTVYGADHPIVHVITEE